MEIRLATTALDAMQVLAEEDVDMVLLDLSLGSDLGSHSQTMGQFDYMPAGARGLDQGQEILRRIRERLPAMPVYLLAVVESDGRVVITANAEATLAPDDVSSALRKHSRVAWPIASLFQSGRRRD